MRQDNKELSAITDCSQQNALSKQKIGILRRYDIWLGSLLKAESSYDELVVNNDPYLRGGICSYNSYLSSMLRAHLWGLWLTAIVIIVLRYFLTSSGLLAHQMDDFGFWPIMIAAVIGSLNWAILVFIGLEKRLRSIGKITPYLYKAALAIVLMATGGIIIGWHIDMVRASFYIVDSYQANNAVLEAGYGRWKMLGQIMVYLGFVLLFLLPCYRSSHMLPIVLKEELDKPQGFPTPILLLFNVVLLIPAVFILA